MKKKKEVWVNEALFLEKVEESGKKKGFLAQRCGLSRMGFFNCIKNRARFNEAHIAVLCAELRIKTVSEKEAIFFAENDSKYESKGGLHYGKERLSRST